MSPDDLQLTAQGNALVAHFSGDIDVSNAERMGRKIADAASGDSLSVVLDLTEVSYLDSFGIYVIAGLLQSLRDRGQTLTLVVPRDSPIDGTLRLADIRNRLPTAEGLDEALRLIAEHHAA